MSTYEVLFATVSMGGKVKPCPFCGGQAQIYDFKDGRYLVECINPDCDVYPYTSTHYDKQEAIDAWNRRAE